MKPIRGFAMLELLVVVVVVMLLASVAIVVTKDTREQSEFDTIAQQLQEIEKAVKLYGLDHFDGVWPNVYRNHTKDSVNNHIYSTHYRLEKLVTGAPVGEAGPQTFPGFSDYLASVPPSPIGGGFYGYYNVDVDVPASCPNAPIPSPHDVPGVSIRIGYDSTFGDAQALYEYLDELFDKGDGENCGRIVRYTPWTNLYYIIATSSKDVGVSAIDE